MRRIFCLGLLIALTGCAGLPIFGHSRYVVFFGTGSAALDQPAHTVIAAAARTALSHPLTKLTVTGAADTDGNTPANVRLSEARARAVAAVLVADGVPAARVRAEGVGEVGSLPASEQASRRAIIHFGLR